MNLRFCALLAVSASLSLNAANVSSVPLGIYYSFDAPPSITLVAEMQSELSRILAPSGLRVTWRGMDGPRDGSEDFPEIVVLRFRGNCSSGGVPAADEPEGDPGGTPLAQTQMIDGHVLPFAEVNCDRLRRFIAPASRSPGDGDKDSALGRAMARVSAHEIYHMITGSESHSAHGIARAAHSRIDLTASTFAFARTEMDWLRHWVDRRADQQSGEDQPEKVPHSSESGAGSGR